MMAATLGHVGGAARWALRPIRVLTVDDSAVARRVIAAALAAAPDIEVVASAPDGRAALRRLDTVAVDAVTLDLTMPGMDGLATLSAIRERRPDLPVVMVSASTGPGAAVTVEALARGAADYVMKPTGLGGAEAATASLRDQLVPRLYALCAAGSGTAVRGRPGHLPHARSARTAPRLIRTAPAGHPTILAIGASTGGPTALTEVLAALPGDLPVPVVVVQHMPPPFTALLAERLDRNCSLRVREAVDGAALAPGDCWIASGGRHLRVERSSDGSVALRFDDGPPEQGVRPSVDVLLRSVAAVHQGGAVAAVLTGMGEDGARGSRAVRDAGGYVVVQDAVTSVVWGMPGAVVRAGAADRVLPLDRVGPVLARVIADGGKARG